MKKTQQQTATTHIKNDKQPKLTPKEDVQTIVDRNQQLEEQLKRALADYQNLERRVEEERKLLNQLSSAILIEKFLPVLDNLESAQKHLNDQGLAIVVKQFKDILTKEGVQEIHSEGAQFDPKLHEAIEVVGGERDNIVVRVIRKGYTLNDNVLRIAQVVVERRKVNMETEEKVEKVQEFGDYA